MWILSSSLQLLKISGMETPAALAFEVAAPLVEWAEVVSSGGAPTPAGTSSVHQT